MIQDQYLGRRVRVEHQFTSGPLRGMNRDDAPSELTAIGGDERVRREIHKHDLAVGQTHLGYATATDTLDLQPLFTGANNVS